MTTSQKEFFLQGEADRYFARNRATYEATAPLNTYSLDFYARFIKPGKSVLEVGCASGINLQYLKEKTSCAAYGIDPSSAAIASGKALFSGVDLRVGTADALPFDDESMDFLLFGFCLYLVDRKLLLRAVAESDRVLRDGGFLCITDFDPVAPKIRPYKHAASAYSYKMDYSRLFLANPAYSLVEKLSFSHSGVGFDPRPEERLGSWVLSKESRAGYGFEEDK